MIPRLPLAVALLLLAGCGSNATLRIYVIGSPGAPTTGVWSDSGLPVFELEAVSVPDYLDSTDILRRTGANEVTASPTGRWGDRLSVGLTRALEADLTKRLPMAVITTTEGAHRTGRIVVAIEQFGVAADGRCVLGARWQVTAGDQHAKPDGEHGAFTEDAGSPDDAAITAAVTRLVDELAEQVVVTVNEELARSAPRMPAR